MHDGAVLASQYDAVRMLTRYTAALHEHSTLERSTLKRRRLPSRCRRPILGSLHAEDDAWYSLALPATVIIAASLTAAVPP